MSEWPSTKTKQVLAALLRLGWEIKRQSGARRTLYQFVKDVKDFDPPKPPETAGGLRIKAYHNVC